MSVIDSRMEIDIYVYIQHRYMETLLLTRSLRSTFYITEWLRIRVDSCRQ